MNILNMELFVKKCVECGHALSEIGVFSHAVHNSGIGCRKRYNCWYQFCRFIRPFVQPIQIIYRWENHTNTELNIQFGIFKR